MGAKFERVERFKNDESIHLPIRKTKFAAGYDFEVAEDIVIHPYIKNYNKMLYLYDDDNMLDKEYSLDQIAQNVKTAKTKLSLVPTGIKCKLDPGTYLELSVRSSCPLKYYLMLANGVGIIDADYYSNPSNDGEIFFQIINFSPYYIRLQKGDVIGQGIIKRYNVADNEIAPEAERTGGFGSTSK